MSIYFAPHEHVKPADDAVVVKEVRAYVIGSKDLEEKSGGGADCHAQASGHWIVDTPIANPMSPYEAYKKSRSLWGIGAIGTMIVEVELENGMIGVGITIGGDAGCFIVEQHLSRFVEGQVTEQNLGAKPWPGGYYFCVRVVCCSAPCTWAPPCTWTPC